VYQKTPFGGSNNGFPRKGSKWHEMFSGLRAGVHPNRSTVNDGPYFISRIPYSR